MGIVIPLFVIFVTCLVIWRACDGFEIASEYIGRNLSEGVRGGTINAISSSVPELFTTLIALFVLGDRDGFAVGLGTTAGSALFNGMIIPAVCILSVVGAVVAGIRVTSVNVSTKVLLRDGLSLIFCEIVLIVLVNGQYLHWWQGLVLIGLYAAYMAYMILSMNAAPDAADRHAPLAATEPKPHPTTPLGKFFYWISGGPLLDLESMMVREKHRRQMVEQRWNGWPLLLLSTFVIGLACWALVHACEWLGSGPSNSENQAYYILGYELRGLNMPAMFVAVIFASMATSVPDTVISIRDARDGDYDDAVANALGSNIFDICFALGFPLFLFTLINGPIEMPTEVVQQSGELRLLLLALSIIGFAIYYIGKRGKTQQGVQYVEMKRGKAVLLLLAYASFVLYIIGRSEQWPAAESLADLLHSLLDMLPKFG